MKILLATEGSKFSEAAIEKCCETFGESADTEIKIVAAYKRIIPTIEPMAISADYIQQVNAEAHRQTNEIAARAEKLIWESCSITGEKITTKIECGSPDQIIVEEAEKWAADLIVVGSHGYGFWKRAWLGSISNSVVQHAPCSVLVIREKNK